MALTYDEVRRIALAFPGVREGRAYGGPSLHVGRKFLGRLREDGETLVLKVALDERAGLLERSPHAFFLTDHYRAHPYVLVNLLAIESRALRRLIERAWYMTASKGAILLYEKRSTAQKT